MEKQSDKFTANLIHKIFTALSQEQVKTIIETAMKDLKNSKTSKASMILFINDISAQLELFNPMKKTAQQWSNISMAKILINRIQNQLGAG